MKNKKFETTVTIIASVLYCMFCNWIMTELPYMTWFDFMPLVDKYYCNTLHLSDLFTRYGEHGMFGYNILFIINVIAFKLTTFFDVYINDINVIVSGIIYIYLLNKIADNTKPSYKFGVILIALTQFSTVQLSSGAMETQVRLGILFFVISAVYVDNIFMKNKNISYKNIIIACLLIIICINVFGTLYTFAGLPMICIVGFWLVLKNKYRLKEIIPILITYVFSTIFYIFEYNLFSGKASVEASSILNNMLAIIMHPLETIKSLIGYNACGIFGSAVYSDGNFHVNIYLLLGFVVTLIIIFSLYKFITTQMYKKTFLPIYFIAYSFLVFVFFTIGRPNYGWQWSLNEWYIVHIKLQFVGVILILTYTYQKIEIKKDYVKAIINVSFMYIVLVSIVGNIIELKRAPYVEQYYQNKQPYLFAETIDDLPIDANGNTPLLAGAETSFNSIETLRKYGLSVYKYYPILEKYRELYPLNIKGLISNYNLLDGQIIDRDGYYSDNWIGKNAEICVYSKTGSVNLKYYCPIENDASHSGVLYVNDQKYCEYKFDNQVLSIPVTVPSNSVVKLKFENNFSFVSPPDTRELSFKLEISK